jgi:hypothetical protein
MLTLSTFLSLHLTLFSQIVIDSIASLAKKEGLNEQDKETYILRQVSRLLSSSSSFDLLVESLEENIWYLLLCHPCNQSGPSPSVPELALIRSQIAPHLPTTAPVTDIYHEIIVDSKNGLFKPALGQSWHHCITTRFVLHHTRPPPSSSSASSPAQHMTVIDVVKSPIVPIYRDQIVYQIGKIGLEIIS